MAKCKPLGLKVSIPIYQAFMWSDQFSLNNIALRNCLQSGHTACSIFFNLVLESIRNICWILYTSLSQTLSCHCTPKAHSITFCTIYSVKIGILSGWKPNFTPLLHHWDFFIATLKLSHCAPGCNCPQFGNLDLNHQLLFPHCDTASFNSHSKWKFINKYYYLINHYENKTKNYCEIISTILESIYSLSSGFKSHSRSESGRKKSMLLATCYICALFINSYCQGHIQKNWYDQRLKGVNSIYYELQFWRKSNCLC
jgi:hypothetical protein